MCNIYSAANMNVIKLFKIKFILPDVLTWGARRRGAEWGRGQGWCHQRPPRPCARAWRRSRRHRRAGSPSWSGIPRESVSTTCYSCVVDADGPGLPHCVLELTEEMGARRRTDRFRSSRRWQFQLQIFWFLRSILIFIWQKYSFRSISIVFLREKWMSAPHL